LAGRVRRNPEKLWGKGQKINRSKQNRGGKRIGAYRRMKIPSWGSRMGAPLDSIPLVKLKKEQQQPVLQN